MNCKEIENILPLYPDDLLSASEKQAVEEHLKTCPKCCKELALLRQTAKMERELKDVEPPPWFKQRIMAQVREEADKKSFVQKWFYPLRIKIPVQIAATIVITVLAVYIYRTGEQEMKAVLPRTAPMIETQKEIPQAPAEASKAKIEAPKAEEFAPPVRHSIKKKSPSRGGSSSDEKTVMYDVSAGGGASALKAEEKSVGENKSLMEDYSIARREAAKDKADAEKRSVLSTRQEAPAKAMPASPAVEPEYRMAEPGFARKAKQYKASAPMQEQSMGAASRQGQTIISLYVADINIALQDVEKILIKFNAQNIVKKSLADKANIKANLKVQNIKDFITQLKTIGKVEEKGTPADNFEQYVVVVIEILN